MAPLNRATADDPGEDSGDPAVRSVVVTVNDRGPFVRGRVVDVSLAAARALGIVERGLARVRVEPVTD